ncbi:MAG: hypothetical protein EXS64_19745 [Candidatus Latescibacteria bacterium]|nr:hypothetical protein [Candidatus Latescibacterota bacterium]
MWAHFISGLLNPISTSALVFWALVSRVHAPVGSRTLWLILGLVFSAVLPLAYVVVLRQKGDISGLLIPDRGQRTRPLLVGIGSYLMGVVALSLAGAPGLLVALMGCYAISTALATLINLRWQISLHAVGAWGTLVALCHGLGYPALYVSPLALGVVWARLRLRAHTPAQLLAGGCLGACITFILLKLWA